MKPVTLKMRVTRQNDGHGCGYCACTSVYRYYGLCPRNMRLRQRLGTDSSILPRLTPFRSFIERAGTALGLDTRGTSCPAVFAVLHADGFVAAAACGDYAKTLRRHLGLGHPALALAGGLAHWIVAAGADDDSVLVLDSSGYCDPTGKNRLRYRLTQEQFADAIDGVVLVRRRRGVRELTAADYTREYVRGVGFALQSIGGAVPGWLGL